MVGLVGDSATEASLDNLREQNPGPARNIAVGAVEQVKSRIFSAGAALLVGIAATLWSASSLLAASCAPRA